LKAEQDIDTGIITVTFPISKKEVNFRFLAGGIAWGDHLASVAEFKNHGLVVGGEREDGLIHVFYESTPQRLSDLASELIELKDAMFVEKFFLPPTPEGHVQILEDTDGLTDYQHDGPTKYGSKKWRETAPKHRWPHFRNRDAKALLLSYDDIVLDDFEAARDHVNRMATNKQIGMSMSLLKRLRSAREDTHEAWRYPIYRAFIGLVWSLDLEKTIREQARLTRPQSWPWDSPKGYVDGLV